MAIALAASGTPVYDTVAGTTTSVPYPAGITAGDCLILFVARSATTITAPAGWTMMGGGNISTTGGTCLMLAYKIAVGTESGSLAVTAASGTGHSRMFRFTGVDQTTPVDVSGTGSTANAATTTLATITTITAGACVIGVGTNAGAAGGTYTISDGTYTEDDDSGAQSGANGRNAAFYHVIKAAAGATGTKTLTHTNARAVGLHAALRPAAGGGTTSITVTATGSSTPSVTRAATRKQAPTASASSSPSVARRANHPITATMGQTPTLVEDFAGSAASGWTAVDSSTIGATGWTVLTGTAATFAETGGAGTITPAVGGALSRIGAGVSLADGEVLCKVALSAIPGTASYQAFVMGRYVSATQHYRIFFQLLPSGVLQTKIQRLNPTATDVGGAFGTTDPSYAANRFYWCRYQYVGEAHRVRFWLDGDPEPSAWVIDTTDTVAGGGYTTAGDVALGALAGAGTAGVTASFDGVRVYDPAAAGGASVSVAPLRLTGQAVTATGPSTPSLVRRPQLVRSVSAASSTAITKRPGLVRALAQGATATVTSSRLRAALSTISAATSLTVQAIRITLVAVTATSGNATTITKRPARAITTAQGSSSSITKRPALVRAVAQASTTTSALKPNVVSRVGAFEADTFTRTITLGSGLGDTDTGDTWTAFSGTTVNTSKFGVNGTKGQVLVDAVNTGRGGILVTRRLADMDVRLTQTLFPTAPTGGNLIYQVGARMGATPADGYFARLSIAATTGAITFSIQRFVGNVATLLVGAFTPPGLAVGDDAIIRIRVTGGDTPTIEAWAWKAGTTPPSAAQLSIADTTAPITGTGRPGFRHQTLGGNTDTPYTILIDDFLVTEPLATGGTAITAEPVRASLLTVTATATSSTSILKGLARTISLAAASSSTVTALRVRLRSITATATSAATITKRAAIARSTTGPSSSTVTRRPGLVRSVAASSSTSASRTPARTSLATAASATSLIRRPARTISALAGSSSTVRAGTSLAVSTAAGAATTLALRAGHLVDLAATSALDTLQAIIHAGALRGRKGGNNRIAPARTQPSIIQAIVTTPAQGRAHGRSAIPSEDGRVTYSPADGTGIIEGGE